MVFQEENLMVISLFFKGLIVGLLIAVPVGPVAILCIQRTLNMGRRHGLVSGLGAACADAIYGFIAAFGVKLVSDFLAEHQVWLRIIAGVCFCGLGMRTFLSKVTKQATPAGRLRQIGDYGSTLALTLMNPMTVLAFAVVFASIGVTGSHHLATGLLVAGVFTGSALWWFTLSVVAEIFRERVSRSNLIWLNKISGTIIIILGLLILLSLML